jgi:hypothetical protein
MSLMSSPRPALADLPLDLILNPNTDYPTRNINRPTSLTGSKRSRSPSLAHPAKRRILEQEGLILTPRSRLRASTSTHSLSTPHRSLLHAPDTSKHLSGPSLTKADAPLLTPFHPDPLDLPSLRESRRISPRLSASPTSKSCSSVTTTPTRASPRKAHPQTAAGSSSSSSRHVRHTMVPREMPLPPNRQSVHYPGFDVHQDTHIALPCTRSMTRAREEAARVQEGEAAKENVRPVAGSGPCKSGKTKGDVVPRRSARLRANNHHSLPQGAITLDVRGREHRRSTLYGVF